MPLCHVNVSIFASFKSNPNILSYRLLRGDRELKDSVTPRELLVDSREGVNLVLDILLILRVKHNLEHLGPVNPHARTLPHDLSRIDEVLKGLVVDRLKGAREGAGLLGNPVGAALAGENAALRDDDHVLPRELLLQLADKALLDPVEALEEAEGHVDDDGLARVGDLDLLGGRDEEILRAIETKGERFMRTRNEPAAPPQPPPPTPPSTSTIRAAASPPSTAGSERPTVVKTHPVAHASSC